MGNGWLMAPRTNYYCLYMTAMNGVLTGHIPLRGGYFEHQIHVWVGYYEVQFGIRIF